MWEQPNKRFFWFAKTILPRQSQAKAVQKSGLIPPTLVEETSVPRFYRETIAQCGADAPHKLPDMNEVVVLMWRSGLAEPVLQAIWESVAPVNKDQLTRQEFYSCLVLIALAQRNMTIADLSSLPSLPIPKLSSVRPKEASLKSFKYDAKLAKPYGHLMKTVHPLFTEQNVKVDGDLISFNENGTRDVSSKTADSSDLVLYPSVDRSSQEANEFLEGLVSSWEKMIGEATKLFSLVKQTNSDMMSTFRTEKGVIFVHSLHEVEQVIRRIHHSLKTSTISQPELLSKCEILLGIWSNFVEILEWTELLERPNEFEQTEHNCHLCGVRTNADNTHFDEDTERSYHISCANFWLNSIEAALPRT